MVLLHAGVSWRHSRHMSLLLSYCSHRLNRERHCVVFTRLRSRPQRHASMHCTMHSCTRCRDTCHVRFNVKSFRSSIGTNLEVPFRVPIWKYCFEYQLSRPDNIMVLKRYSIMTTIVFINNTNICVILYSLIENGWIYRVGFISLIHATSLNTLKNC